MIKSNKPKNYWTYEKCQKEALNYNTRIEFIKKSNKAYNAARRHHWLEKCCKHMTRLGSKYKRLIYAFEFPDKSVYIGLTFNSKKRKWSHLNEKESQVFKRIKKTSLQPKFIELTTFIEKEIASKMEGEFLEFYRKNGWLILNNKKTGGLGGNTLLWTKEKCIEEANKFEKKSDWQKSSGSSYNSAKKNNWFNECISHMKTIRNNKNYWNKFSCFEEAQKYSSKVAWIKTNPYSYTVALKNNWIKFCTKHMDDPRRKWTFNSCLFEAKKFNKKNDWRQQSSVSYSIASKNDWINLIWQSKYPDQHQD